MGGKGRNGTTGSQCVGRRRRSVSGGCLLGAGRLRGRFWRCLGAIGAATLCGNGPHAARRGRSRLFERGKCSHDECGSSDALLATLRRLHGLRAELRGRWCGTISTSGGPPPGRGRDTLQQTLRQGGALRSEGPQCSTLRGACLHGVCGPPMTLTRVYDASVCCARRGGAGGCGTKSRNVARIGSFRSFCVENFAAERLAPLGEVPVRCFAAQCVRVVCADRMIPFSRVSAASASLQHLLLFRRVARYRRAAQAAPHWLPRALRAASVRWGVVVDVVVAAGVPGSA